MHKDHPLYGFKYKSSAKNGDMYKKDNEFYFLKVKRKNGEREGKAVMTKVGEDTVIAKLNYKNDELNGKCTRSYEDHTFKCTLKNDILDGPFSEYDRKGKLICEGVYENGVRKEEKFSSSTKKTAAAAGAATAGTATAAATGAAGATAALLGFGSPGIVGGSLASSAMSTAWTTGFGTGLISAAQSAGALFMNAVGGSYLVATAAVAAPVAVAGAAGYGIYKLMGRKKKNAYKDDSEDSSEDDSEDSSEDYSEDSSDE